MEGILTTQPYSKKAHLYMRYRWDYAAPATRMVMDVTGIGASSSIADIGAGTGILTRHFVEHAQCIYAVEPDPAMRSWACQLLGHYASFRCIDGYAEATTLPDQCADVIVVGQALHWFDALPARREFVRILKPGGWLAVLWNHGTDERLDAALQAVRTEQNGWQAPAAPSFAARPLNYYYGSEDYLRRTFPVSATETWEEFFGGLCSDSHAPNEDHPAYERFERSAREVFDRLSADGRLDFLYSTELALGKLYSTS